MVTVATGDESPLTNATFNGELSSADYWDDEPKIFSAGMGFDNIIANELTEEAALELAAPGTAVVHQRSRTLDANRTSMAPQLGDQHIPKATRILTMVCLSYSVGHKLLM